MGEESSFHLFLWKGWQSICGHFNHHSRLSISNVEGNGVSDRETACTKALGGRHSNYINIKMILIKVTTG